MKFMEKISRKKTEEFARIALVASIIAWFAAGLALKAVVESAFFGIALGLCVFTALMVKELSRDKANIGLFEKELPFALNSFALSLSLGSSFEDCLKAVADGGYRLVSKEFSNSILLMEKQGSSVQDSLRPIAARYNSLDAKRAVSQVVAVYEQGSRTKSCDSINRIASEILRKQKSEARDFSGKLVVFSLLFIAVSAIVPAIFQAYIIIGGLFLKTDFTPLDVFLIVAIGFPVLDIGILAFIRSKTPVFMR